MDSTTTPSITDQDTAVRALNKSRDDLASAIGNADQWMKDFRDTIVQLRPMGVLTVDEMAEAIGKDRNYVDTVWSDHGDATKGKQTRVHVDAPEGEGQRHPAAGRLRPQGVRHGFHCWRPPRGAGPHRGADLRQQDPGPVRHRA